jgi:hypothetical protein
MQWSGETCWATVAFDCHIVAIEKVHFNAFCPQLGFNDWVARSKHDNIWSNGQDVAALSKHFFFTHAQPRDAS